MDQQYDNRLGCPQPDTPQRSLLIYPRRGQFAVFDGCLGHGVLGSSSREQRVTLLVNWWSHKPQACLGLLHPMGLGCTPAAVLPRRCSFH